MSDGIMQEIVAESNKYAKQNGTELELNIEELKSFIGLLLIIMGFHSLLSMRRYWSTDPNFYSTKNNQAGSSASIASLRSIYSDIERRGLNQSEYIQDIVELEVGKIEVLFEKKFNELSNEFKNRMIDHDTAGSSASIASLRSIYSDIERRGSNQSEYIQVIVKLEVGKIEVLFEKKFDELSNEFKNRMIDHDTGILKNKNSIEKLENKVQMNNELITKDFKLVHNDIEYIEEDVKTLKSINSNERKSYRTDSMSEAQNTDRVKYSSEEAILQVVGFPLACLQ
ncbi:hypothetical protein JTB14_017524 [Gonioctena quinquepunctata]|nr:hypothetical protein JTB14_017524 [Gonioctena quinquepunctata]